MAKIIFNDSQIYALFLMYLLKFLDLSLFKIAISN